MNIKDLLNPIVYEIKLTVDTETGEQFYTVVERATNKSYLLLDLITHCSANGSIATHAIRVREKQKMYWSCTDKSRKALFLRDSINAEGNLDKALQTLIENFKAMPKEIKVC